MMRHWSFIVTDKRYLYTLAIAFLLAGGVAAFRFKDPTHLSRAGNFIIGTGVWMSMRYTLREGLKRHTNLADQSPVVPGTNALNSNFINQLVFTVGDAHLQVHGFVLVLVGSAVGSFGDLLIRWAFSATFQ